MLKKKKSNFVKLIANPGAGKVDDAAKNLKLVIAYLEKEGLKVDLEMIKPKQNVQSIARRAIKVGFALIVAMGGDGTIEAIMRGMTGSKARLGIIPLGTENNIAISLGIPKDLEEACALIASDNILTIDLGEVKIWNGKKFVFFEMATIGLGSTIYPDAKNIGSGKLSSIFNSLITLIHQETNQKIFLTLDDKNEIEVETMLVMVSNTPVFGKNFMVAPKASLHDGLLDISVYPGFSKAELVSYYASVMNGGYSDNEKVRHYRARKVKVKSYPKLEVMADEVALGKGTVTIRIFPGGLQVIAVKKSPGLDNPQKNIDMKLPEPISPKKSADLKSQRKNTGMKKSKPIN